MSDHGKAHCAEIGGECITERDGYYMVSYICLAVGVSLLVLYVRPTARRLQGTFLCTQFLLSLFPTDAKNGVGLFRVISSGINFTDSVLSLFFLALPVSVWRVKSTV